LNSKEAEILDLATQIRDGLLNGKFQTVSDVQKLFPDVSIRSIEQAIGFAGYSIWNGKVEAPLPPIVIDLAIWIVFGLSLALLIGSILVRDK
jgi:hypothetical protein